VRIPSSKIVVLSIIFAIVLPLAVVTVTTVVLSEPENFSPKTSYEHVILIVVDDVRPDILVGANTPNIDNLMASGSFTLNAWTVTPSVTIAAIPSIYTGATPEVHGVTSWDGEIHAETIVEVFEESGLPCAIVGEDPILGGYSATYCTGYYSNPHPDENFTSVAINLLRENDFYFISIYNPVPDKMGHQYGHNSPQYREAIENADYHIGRLVENLKELGVYDNTLIVITPDHGITGTSHGYGYETDMRVFSVWHGPGVKQGYEMADSIYIPASATYDETYVAHRIIDIAPTMTELVGVRPPENAEGEVIRQIFEGALTPHDPIYIDGNDNFTPANGVNGGGSGTISNPYIIENWDISAENANGIWIENTTSYFIIRNCYVHDGGSNNNGIRFENVANGVADNNTCESNNDGINLQYSNSNHISNNIAENNNGVGIMIGMSSNNILSKNACESNNDGICQAVSDNNILHNNTCESNEWRGILLWKSHNNALHSNICNNNRDDGMWLYDSDNNTLDNNTCENNVGYGIHLYSSDNNTLYNNTSDNNEYGIFLSESSNNTMANNTCNNNHYNFGVDGSDILRFEQDIDSSNLVDGRPVYYLRDRRNEVIDPSWNPGYVGLVRCDNIRVENLVLENNHEGILLVDTENSWIENCIFSNNGYGIHLDSSSNNTMTNNTCNKNVNGILLWSSSNNAMTNNACSNNEWGISFYYSSNNTLYNNTSDNNNYHGILLIWSNNNCIYHNNITNNKYQAYDDGTGTNYWDNDYPSGGNYWSDYTGTDVYHGENQDIFGGDGIGDTPYYIPGGSNRDRYPLTEGSLGLFAGWNMLGFTGVNENDTPDNILDGQTYYLWKWDAVNTKYVSPPTNQPVELGVGYWIWVDHNQRVATSGAPVDNYSIDLVAGWNMIGFPATDENTKPDNILPSPYYIWRWNAENTKYVSPSPTAPVELGVGYWVWVAHDQTVTVP